MSRHTYAVLVGAALLLSPIPSEALMVSQQRLIADFVGGEAQQPRSTPDERARAAAFLVDAIADLGLTPQRHDYRMPNVNGLVDLLFPPYRGTNVYTVIEATSPSTEYVIVGAHYDSEPDSPGAGDNATGVALVYTLAHALARMENRQFNYLLVFFDQEEDDEVGSKAFVRFLQRNDYAVHSVHITDLAGWDDDGDGVIEVQSPGSYLEGRYRLSARRLGISLRITQGGSSDNKSFLDAGFRTAGVFGDITRHLHRSTDTIETVDFEFLASMTALVTDVLTNLPADAP